MSTMIQVRNVPEAVHRRLKARAAEAGLSLSDFVLRRLAAEAGLPTKAEMRERLRALPPLDCDVDTGELVRDARKGRAR